MCSSDLYAVDRLDYAAFTAYLKERVRHDPKPDATIDDVVRHIEHVREVAGIDHVGLGGDFDGTDTYPVGLADVAGSVLGAVVVHKLFAARWMAPFIADVRPR